MGLLLKTLETLPLPCLINVMGLVQKVRQYTHLVNEYRLVVALLELRIIEKKTVSVFMVDSKRKRLSYPLSLTQNYIT